MSERIPLNNLLPEATTGSVPVCFASIPTARVIRYDPTFRPERTPDGEAVVTQIMRDWERGNFHALWVYPRGDMFVSSDHYFTLAAADRGKPDFLPCWVLGRPSSTVAKDIQGPMEPTALCRMLGVQP